MSLSNLICIIELGSDTYRATIAQIVGSGQWKILDRAERPITLGKDVFTTGSVSQSTLFQSLKILSYFREMTQGWGIEKDDIHLFATSALREARNRNSIIDRISIKTGFHVKIIENVQATHLTFMGVESTLSKIWKMVKRTNTLIMEVGGGASELMLLNQGNIQSAHTLNIGCVRFSEHVLPSEANDFNIERVLKEQLQTILHQIQAEYNLKKIRIFIAVGSVIGNLAISLKLPCEDDVFVLESSHLNSLIKKIKRMEAEEMVRQFGLSFHHAENLLPALLIFQQFFECTNASKLHIAKTTLRDGILRTLSSGEEQGVISTQLHSQILASARGLAQKYNTQISHSEHVTKIALQIYDQLKEEHGMGAAPRLYLHIASLLHGIGKFVAHSAHHKHGEYIINNSQIFGLNRDEHLIVGSIVRYHRRALPNSNHLNWNLLDKQAQLIVNKLAAILRLAEALERTYSQKIHDVQLRIDDEHLIIIGYAQSDIHAEQAVMKEQKTLFEEVYGLKVRLTPSENRRAKRREYL